MLFRPGSSKHEGSNKIELSDLFTDMAKISELEVGSLMNYLIRNNGAATNDRGSQQQK